MSDDEIPSELSDDYDEGGDFEDAHFMEPEEYDPYETRRQEEEPESTLPSEWKFLYKWFVQLRHASVGIEKSHHPDTDRIRIGRDPDDWWISVRILPNYPRWDLRKYYVKHYRAMREALLLTTILAEIDYDAWKRELNTVSEFRAPDKFGMPIRRLARKFAFEFGDDATMNEYDWVKLKDLFGANVLSKAFKADMAQAMSIAMSKGLDVITMEPIPVHITFKPGRGKCRSQSKGVYNIVNTVNTMKDMLNTRGTQPRASKNFLPLVFKLESIDLLLGNAHCHAAVLDAIRVLLCTGVSVRSLALPELAHCYNLWEETELMESLSLLLCAVCRVKPGMTTRVRHLFLATEFGAIFMSPCYLACLLSALASARGLESIHFDASSFSSDIEKNETVW